MTYWPLEPLSKNIPLAKGHLHEEDAVVLPAVVEGPASRPLVLLALVYAFGLPMLGLQEKAGCLMFSQLRLHAGSNHYMLPTSLLSG